MLLARAYSHHSLLLALPKIKALISDCKNKGYTAIALTDEDTASGLVEFYDECISQDVKPVLGATLSVPNFSRSQENFSRNQEFSKIAILAKNVKGYKNLLELVSIARTVREQPIYHITLEDIFKLRDNTDTNDLDYNFFVVLAGNDHELISNLRQNKLGEAKDILNQYVNKVGNQNLLVELAIAIHSEEEDYIKKLNLKLVELCKEFEVICIPSPAPRYMDSTSEEAYRVVLAIKSQVKLYDIKPPRDFALPTKLQLQQKFDYLPECLDTTAIESQIDIKIRTDYDKHADEAFFPPYHLIDGQNSADRLAWESYLGLLVRFHPDQNTKEYWQNRFSYEKLKELKEFAATIVPDPQKLPSYTQDYWQEHSIQEYIDRIEYELKIIFDKGYPSYFLVFADIMQFCRNSGIVTNTRGSAAGSMVSYLNGISVLDPIQYILPFERFLNPLRPSPPDIDGDFADDRRDEVINYITQKYGQDKVSQIITFGTMLPRMVVRDVGRALGISYTKCDKLAKLIPTAPQGRKATFKWAMETSEELKEVYEKDDECGRIINISQIIEGNYRHASVHAAGLLISPTKLTDYCSIQWDSDHKSIACQYDMKICEKVGLVKMDILGITNLSFLGNSLEAVAKRRGQKLDLLNLDTRDKKTFELLAEGKTMGIFQLSSAGMTRYLIQLRPSRIEDLATMGALYRPGPMANIPEFIKRKNNPKLITYYVPQMQEWMSSTYGILVFQEDLLLTAINLAGYDWGEADTLRKGMGKKIQAVIDSQHKIFVEGCVKHSEISQIEAEKIWADMIPFAAYGFNKAHATSYGMVSFWTAYMKANYPTEFMTALMTSESNDLVKISSAISECQAMNLRVLPPDINKSFDNFTIEDDQTIRYGMSSIKNLGSDVIKFIISEREKNGPYKNLEDSLDRLCQYQALNKRSIEALIVSGCFDNILA